MRGTVPKNRHLYEGRQTIFPLPPQKTFLAGG